MTGTRSLPVVLTIAGSDSSAGAGLQADLKAFHALGVYGVTAVTCVVAEAPGLVRRIDSVPTEGVLEQIEVLFGSFPIAAVKTGLLHTRNVVEAVTSTLQRCIAASGRNVPVVVDPVMVATSGDLLLSRDAVAAYEATLFPMAQLLTPNLDEAGTLLERDITDDASMRKGGAELAARYGVPILLKGGHLHGDRAVDLLITPENVFEFSAPFVRGVVTHGTGCTYSAAIAAGLALGLPLTVAIEQAKQFVTQAISQHFTWPNSIGGSTHALRHTSLPNTTGG
jgi:hydroxymethylpyrimidine/phosphomethylpyrimidine kinase